MSMSIKEAANITNKNITEFTEWIFNMKGPSHITKEEDEVVHCIYTDGDGGVVYIKGYSEMCGSDGFTLQAVEETNYCDFPFDYLISMITNVEAQTRHLDWVYNGD